ncbi:MAG: hypothetical protein JO203_05540, partial [Gammaproteobacteria bacterium]|nr:hypothetical protein [Gammaproteobacteria bacterium]
MASASSAPRSQSATPGSAAATPAAQPSADITAITTHDDFLLELGQTLGGQAAVRPVDSLEAALDAMAGAKRGQLLVIDARDLEDVRAAVDKAHTQVPQAVVLVFAEAHLEKRLADALKASRVFAMLPMPLDARKTQAVVEGALSEAIARRSAAATSANPLTTLRSELSVDSFAPRPAAAGIDLGRGSRRPSPLLLGAGGAALLALAAGGLW